MSSDVRGIVFVGLTKDMLQVYELNFGCHREFRVWYLVRRVCAISIKVAQR